MAADERRISDGNSPVWQEPYRPSQLEPAVLLKSGYGSGQLLEVLIDNKNGIKPYKMLFPLENIIITDIPNEDQPLVFVSYQREGYPTLESYDSIKKRIAESDDKIISL